MKIKMTGLYRNQIMKPLLHKILSLQLLIEDIFLPKLEDEADWNQKLFKFSGEEFNMAKNEVKRTR